MFVETVLETCCLNCVIVLEAAVSGGAVSVILKGVSTILSTPFISARDGQTTETPLCVMQQSSKMISFNKTASLTVMEGRFTVVI